MKRVNMAMELSINVRPVQKRATRENVEKKDYVKALAGQSLILSHALLQAYCTV